MRNPATPTLDQLLVLLAVVDTGSFTAAAKRLGRATSAVSYAIDTLAQAREASPPQARDFVQLVLSERQPAAETRDLGVVSLNTWRIGDQATRHKLLLAGLGWGGMPEPIVRADIESGRLVRLNLPDWRGGEYNMQAIHKIDTPPGPAGRWLIERLVTLSDKAEAPVPGMTKPIKRKGRRRPPRRQRSVSARKRGR